MKFEERLSEIINEAEVPDELLPQNIAVMLRERSTQTNRNAGYKDKNTARRRIIIFRTSAAAVAACAALAVGIAALPGNEDAANQLEAPIEYEATSPESYDALFNTYTGITLNGSAVPDSEITLDEAARSGDNAGDGFSSGDFTDTRSGNASEADIMKIDGNYMYCLKGRNLYVISLETMETVSQTESSITPPTEMYIDGDRLILISKENIYTHDSGNEKADGVTLSTGNLAPVSDVPAKDTDTHNPMYDDSDSPDRAAPTDKTGTASETENGESAIPAAYRTNTVVDIYDVSEPERPVHTTAYKQNGSYVSSKFSDGTLYLVTDHSDYRVKPLDTSDDLDEFVPAYYLNGEKSYIDAEDIIIPSNAASTDYTVVSAIRAEDAAVSVKAVLGSGRNVYCSSDSLYVAGVGAKDGRSYTVISAFDLTQGGISYRASGSVEGMVIGQQSMNEYGGFFRIAAEITDNEGNASVSVYVLDRSLTVVNSAGGLVPGSRISAVRFEKQYARLIDAASGESALVLDLSENPPVVAGSLMGNEAYLCGYSEDMLLGVGRSREGGLTLTMYSSETGLALNGTVFGNEKDGEAEIIGEVGSKALTDRRAVLIDSENGIIGVPAYSHNEFGTKNSYYVYSYNAVEGFVLKGVIEYVDVDDSMIFSRGAVKDGTLYVISSGRVISARLDDLKIIGVYEY